MSKLGNAQALGLRVSSLHGLKHRHVWFSAVSVMCHAMERNRPLEYVSEGTVVLPGTYLNKSDKTKIVFGTHVNSKNAERSSAFAQSYQMSLL